MSTSDKSKITLAVLSYLIEHQNAQDTLEGIVEWWLMEQKIKQQTATVEEVLGELVKREYLLESKGRDSRSRYRINQDKRAEIFSLIEHSTS